MLDIIERYNEDLKADREKMQEISDKISSRREKVEKLQKQIERQEGHIKKLEKQKDDIFFSRGWVQGIVEPLAEVLAQRTGLKWEIYGPFGLRCETSIYLRADMSKSITEQETRSIRLTPATDQNGTEYCMYDTGETEGGYEPMSIGWLNGFNHKTAPLPDTIEEIEKLLVTTGASKEAHGNDG